MPLVRKVSFFIACFTQILIWTQCTCSPRKQAATESQQMKVELLKRKAFDSVLANISPAAQPPGEQATPAEIERFDMLYDRVVQIASKYGSFSDGGLEPSDFSSSRYVDPVLVLTFSSNIQVPEPMWKEVLKVLQNFRHPSAVIFDGPGGLQAVTSTGRFLAVH